MGGRGASATGGNSLNGTARAQRMNESELRDYIRRNRLTRAYNMTINNMNNASYSNQIRAMRRVVADNIDVRQARRR